MRGWLVTLLVFGMGTLSVRAQQADCLITLLGRPLYADSVRRAMAELGIAVKPEAARLSLISMPKEGVLLRTKAGILTDIYLFNDSIPFQGEVYRRFHGAVPLGLTFSDTVGIEENILFQQKAAEYGQREDGLYFGRVQMESGGLGYILEQGYLTKETYQYYVQSYPSVKWRRTLYYRYSLVRRVKGRYLDMPLICGSSNGGNFTAKARNTRADSSYYVSLYGGYRGIANSGPVRRALNDGGMFGGNIMFPVNQKISPPLMHVIGLEAGFYNYRDSTRLFTQSDNSAPSHTQLSFYYGLVAMPWMGPRPHLAPIGQILGGLQVDYSPTLTNFNGNQISSSSASWFYQIGAGLGYQFKSGIILQGLVQYRATRFVRFLQYNSLEPITNSHGQITGYQPSLELGGTRFRTVSVELVVRLNLVND